MKILFITFFVPLFTFSQKTLPIDYLINALESKNYYKIENAIYAFQSPSRGTDTLGKSIKRKYKNKKNDLFIIRNESELNDSLNYLTIKLGIQLGTSIPHNNTTKQSGLKNYKNFRTYEEVFLDLISNVENDSIYYFTLVGDTLFSKYNNDILSAEEIGSNLYYHLPILRIYEFPSKEEILYEPSLETCNVPSLFGKWISVNDEDKYIDLSNDCTLNFYMSPYFRHDQYDNSYAMYAADEKDFIIYLKNKNSHKPITTTISTYITKGSTLTITQGGQDAVFKKSE